MGLTIIPAILLLTGAALIGWGLTRRRSLGGLPSDWRRVAGTVIDAGDGVTTAPRIEYRTPDGRRLRVPGPLATPLAVGDEVAVLIDPKDPKRARLDMTEQEATRVVRTLIACGVVLLVLGALTGFAFL